MKNTLKNLQDINTLSEVGSCLKRPKSGKSALPTTHILDLSMRRNERDRILTELKKIKKRKILLIKRLKIVEEEMDELVNKIGKAAQDLRDKESTDLKVGKGKKKNVVLEY